MAQLDTSILLTTRAMECPFCRSTVPELIDLGTTFWVSCKACSANGPSGYSAEQAVEYWNSIGHVTEEKGHDMSSASAQ